MRRMNSFGRQGLVAALENEELVEDAPVVEEGAGAETVETELLEVNDEAAEASEDQEQIEEAAETAEALESIAVAMESAAANGGLNKEGALALGIALDHMYKSVGINTAKVKSMPALESFGGTSSRVGATQIALEGIKDQVKKIWEAIKKAVLDSIEWIKERYTKIFGAANRLEKRAKALADRAENETNGVKEKDVKSERLVKALHVGGTVGKMTAEAESLKTIVTDFLGRVANEKTAEGMAESFEKGDVKAVLDGYLYDVQQAKHLQDAAAGEGGGVGEGVKLKRSQELAGGQAVFFRFPEAVGGSADEQAIALGKMGGFMAPVGKKAPTKDTLPTLAASDAAKVAELVADMAVELQKYKAALGKIEALKKRIAKGVEKIGSEAAKETEQTPEEKQKLKALQKLGSVTTKLLDQPSASLSVYALNTGKSMLDYVELSLKNHGQKD